MQAPPWHGRGTELGRILEAMRAGQRGAAIIGEPGIGKTRLATQVRDAAEAEGWAVRWALATPPMAAVPFGAIAHLLDPPDNGGMVEVERDPLAMLQRAAVALQRSAGGPLALVVDDAHALDPLTAGLLVQLAGRDATFVLVTARAGEPAPDAVRALWSGDGFERVDLGPLASHEVAAVAEGTLGGPVDGRTLRFLCDVTRGNPLFLRETLADGEASGALTNRGGIWTWRGPLGGRPQLQELIDLRLRDLTDEQRAALEVLAVGGPLDVEVAPKLIDPAVAEELERAGLVSIRPISGTLLGIADPLFEEVVRAEVPVLARQRIERSVAEVLEASGAAESGDLLRLARLRLRCGDGSPSLLTAAAHAANAVHDRRLAEELARAALEQDDSQVDAWLALGEALGAEGRFVAAEGVLLHLIGTPMDDRQRVQLALHLLTATFWGRGRIDDAEEELQQIAEELDDPSWVAVIEAIRADMLTVAGRIDEAVEIVRRLFADPDTPAAAKARGSSAVSALTVSGHAYEALSYGPALAEAAAASEDLFPQATAWVIAARLLALYAVSDFEEMDALLGAVYDLAVESGVDESRAAIAMLLGHRCLTQGLPRTAARWLREAAAVFHEQDPSRYGCYVHGLLAWAEAQIGDVDAAERAMQRATELDLPVIGINQPDRLIGKAWVAWAKGERTRAVSLAQESARVAAGYGLALFEAHAWHEAYRLGAPPEPGLVDRLTELVDLVDGNRVAAYARHVTAARDDDAAGFEAAAAALANAGEELAAAEAWREAAAAHKRAGLDSSSMRCLRASATLVDRCEGARTPMLEIPVGEAPVLTRREQEIVGLAARGLTNAEIAERLVLSVRTVEGHLYNAFGKLGITERQELGSL